MANNRNFAIIFLLIYFPDKYGPSLYVQKETTWMPALQRHREVTVFKLVHRLLSAKADTQLDKLLSQ